MILPRRMLPIITPILMGIIIRIFALRPDQWFWIGIVMYGCVIATVIYMWSWQWRRAETWITMIPLLELMAGGVGLLFFLTTNWVRLSVVFIILIMIGVYFEALFFYRYQHHQYTHLSLPHIAFIMHVMSFFMGFSTLFALHLIQVLPIWIIIVATPLVTGMVMFHVTWSHRLPWKGSLVAACTVAFLLSELVSILLLWPTSFYVNGMLMAIMFYCVPSFLQLQLRGALGHDVIMRYTFVSIFAFLGVIFTTTWS